MADNYVAVSMAIYNLVPVEQEWWENLIRQQSDCEDESIESNDLPDGILDYTVEVENRSVFLWNTDFADVDVLADTLSKFISDTGYSYAIPFTWAETCSKPRTDEFGGGACVVNKLGAHWMHTHEWAHTESLKG